jgi:Cdc6-like AAA superfamily ATPase
MAVNPYSAEHPAPPHKFAGRKGQIEEFSRYLSDTIEGNSKNLAVLGGWGVGKTSLLWTFEDMATKWGCTPATIQLGDATDSLVTLFESITRYLATDIARTRKFETAFTNFLNGLTVSVRYGPVDISFEERQKVTPNTLKFREDLIKIFEQTKTPFLVMLDNVRQISLHEDATGGV